MQHLILPPLVGLTAEVSGHQLLLYKFLKLLFVTFIRYLDMSFFGIISQHRQMKGIPPKI